jgi:protein-S-isoprenylcysteine O-methyltransferase Ste14
MNEKHPDNANVIALPPFIFLGFFVVGLVFHYFFKLLIVNEPGFASILDILGIALIVVSLILPVLAFKALEKSKTTHKVSEPTTAIVSSGIFGYTRNPIYLSGFILFVGISFITNSLILIILTVPLFFVIREGVVKREENYLERKFGQEFIDYKKSVRRWI